MSTSSSAKRNSYGQGFWIGLVSVAVITVAAFVTYSLLTRPKETHSPLSNELSFSPMLVGKNDSGIMMSEQKVSTAEDNLKILSFKVTLADAEVTISEHPQQEQFVDIPEYKDRVLNNVAKQYGTVQTSNGVIYLGRMTKQEDRQLGVMLEKGLIIFMNPSRDLTDAEWRQLGEVLELTKLTR